MRKPLWAIVVASTMTIGGASANAQSCCSPSDCCSLPTFAKAVTDRACCDPQIVALRDDKKYTTGIGIQVIRVNDATDMTVGSLTPGGPGEKAGLAVGDEILSINDTNAEEVLSGDLLKVLTQSESIRMKVQRGAETIVLEIVPVLDTSEREPVRRVQTYESGAPESAAGPKIGELAPEIAAEDTDGIPFKLSDYRGKVVVLSFWGFW